MLSLPREVLDIIAETPSIWVCLRRTCHDLHDRGADIYTWDRAIGGGYQFDDHTITKVSTNDTILVDVTCRELRVSGEMPALESSVRDNNAVGVINFDGYKRYIYGETIVLAKGTYAWLGDINDIDALPAVKHIFYDRAYKVTGIHLEFGQFTPPAPFAYSNGQKIILCESPREVAGITVLLLVCM